jgi:hypothetical protein
MHSGYFICSFTVVILKLEVQGRKEVEFIEKYTLLGIQKNLSMKLFTKYF